MHKVIRLLLKEACREDIYNIMGVGMIQGCFFYICHWRSLSQINQTRDILLWDGFQQKKGFIMMKIAPLERCKSVKIAIATYEITVIFCMYIF